MSDEQNKQTLDDQPSSETRPVMPGLLRNYVSFIGMAIGAAGLISIALLVLIELSSGADNPYTVLVTYILLPGVLLFGIALVGGFGILKVVIGVRIDSPPTRGGHIRPEGSS